VIQGPSLQDLDLPALQKVIASNVDCTQLDAQTHNALKSDQLNLDDLLRITFLANEGLLVFKPTTSNTFEVMFTHVSDFRRAQQENFSTQNTTEILQDDTIDTTDFERLVQNFESDLQKIDLDDSCNALNKKDAACVSEKSEIDILLGR